MSNEETAGLSRLWELYDGDVHNGIVAEIEASRAKLEAAIAAEASRTLLNENKRLESLVRSLTQTGETILDELEKKTWALEAAETERALERIRADAAEAANKSLLNALREIYQLFPISDEASERDFEIQAIAERALGEDSGNELAR